MANLIVNPSFERELAGGAGWHTSGEVFRVSGTAFERETAAALLGTTGNGLGNLSVLSQLVQVPEQAASLRVTYAIRQGNEELYEDIQGTFQVQIQWFGSADAGLPLLRTDTVETIEEEHLMNEGWQTHYTTTPQKPEGAVWARLRFIHRIQEEEGTVYVDQVVVTPEAL